MEGLEKLLGILRGDCISIMDCLAKEGPSPPSLISGHVNMGKRKVLYCLEKLREAGLVNKVDRGVYKLSPKGYAIYNNILSLFIESGDIYIWNDDGFIRMDFPVVESILGNYLPSSGISKYYNELKSLVASKGVLSKEYLILLLSHLLIRDGYIELSRLLSKQLISIDTNTLIPSNKSIYRKVLENILIGHAPMLYKDNKFAIDTPEYLTKCYALFLTSPEIGSLNLRPQINEYVYLHSDSPSFVEYLSLVPRESYITINIDYERYSPDVNDMYRRLLEFRKAFSVVIHVDDLKILGDDLTLRMLFNNAKMGIDTLFVNASINPNRLYSSRGYSASVLEGGDILQVLIATLNIDVESLFNQGVKETFLRDGLNSLSKYVRWKSSVLGLDGKRSFSILVFDRLSKLIDKSNEKVLGIISDVDRVVSERRLGYISYGVSEPLDNKKINLLLNGYTPPIKTVVIDVDDLKLTLAKFIKSGYQLLKIIVRS